AVLLHRRDVASRHPKAWTAVARLAGRIDAATMIHLNAQAEIDQRDFASIAAAFLGTHGAARGHGLVAATFAPDFPRLLAQHAALVFASLAAAIVLGVPLGIAAARRRWLSQPILLATGLVQTIPALALLAFLIPVTGTIGVRPALAALFLYALL